MKIKTLNPSKFSIKGNERFDFLQNIITNNLIKDDSIILSYLLTPQGKIYSEIQIKKYLDSLEIICTNDQVDLYSYFEKYSKLSDVSLDRIQIDKSSIDENYFINLLSRGRIDSNFLPHSKFLPSEIHENYIDFQKGCFIGQEVVSRIKHRQLNKRKIQIFKKLDNDKILDFEGFEIIKEINDYLIIRYSIDNINDSFFEKLSLKKIELI